MAYQAAHHVTLRHLSIPTGFPTRTDGADNAPRGAGAPALPSPGEGAAPPRPLVGIAAIAMAIAFNVPYSILTVTYDYPAVLRRPAGEALSMFAAGGDSLILTWHAFALTALLLVPLAMALALTPRAIARTPGLAVGAAIAGSLAGLTQAIGLWRWVFVIPELARIHSDPTAGMAEWRAAEQAFEVLNLYGGVAIGEHLGQMMTALFVLLLSLMQWRDAGKVTAGIGFATALCLVVGTQEGVALALGRNGDAFTVSTIVGFLGLTAWLIATGIGLRRRPR